MIAGGSVYRLVYRPVRWLVPRLAHVTIVGAEHMPRGGGVLLVSNHLTNFDVFVIGMCFKRILNFMGKAELFRNPLLAWVWGQLYGFSIRRGEADRAALRHTEDLLRAGRVVAVFPEGHRSVTGALQPGQPGIALIARRAGVPVLPVAVTGTQHFLPPDLWRWRPWRRPSITVTIGEPFTLSRAMGRAANQEATDAIMARVASLLPPANRGAYADKVPE